MEKFCNPCSSEHVPLDVTWSNKGSLHPSNYDPFKDMHGHKEEFCCGSRYNTNSTSWTRESNVTPDNSSLYHTAILNMNPHKERFGYSSHSTYARMGKTWEPQKPYTTN